VLADFRLHGESLSQRNLGKSDLDGILKFQHQLAEPRTIRRAYGINLSANDHVNGAVDCALNFWFRFLKLVKRRLAAGKYPS
jgi:hypothetical protein